MTKLPVSTVHDNGRNPPFASSNEYTSSSISGISAMYGFHGSASVLRPNDQHVIATIPAAASAAVGLYMRRTLRSNAIAATTLTIAAAITMPKRSEKIRSGIASAQNTMG